MVQQVWGQKIEGYAMYSVWRKLKMIEQNARHMNRELSSLDRKLNLMRVELEEIQM